MIAAWVNGPSPTPGTAELRTLRDRLLDDLQRPARDEEHRADRLVREVAIWLDEGGRP